MFLNRRQITLFWLDFIHASKQLAGTTKNEKCKVKCVSKGGSIAKFCGAFKSCGHFINCSYVFPRLFFVIEFVSGGDLMYHMQRQRRLPEDHAR